MILRVGDQHKQCILLFVVIIPTIIYTNLKMDPLKLIQRRSTKMVRELEPFWPVQIG